VQAYTLPVCDGGRTTHGSTLAIGSARGVRHVVHGDVHLAQVKRRLRPGDAIVVPRRSMRCEVSRKSDVERAALSWSAVDFDAASMRLGDGAADRQTETEATRGACRVRSVKALEQVGQMLRSNPNTSISHGKERCCPIGRDSRDTHLAASRCVQDAVFDQVRICQSIT
jgi:hypothetical protein